MALSRTFVSSLLLLLLAAHLVESRTVLDHQMMAGYGRALLQATKGTATIDCAAACGVRCSKTWNQKMCKKMCGVCCSKCKCVPPGTSAETRAMCPCYANMKNPKGHLKCP